MNLKSPEEIIKKLTKKYLVDDDNIIYVRKLFIAASIVRWAFKNASKNEEIIQYITQIEKFLDGQINLYWENGIIKVERNKKDKQ